jgi:hypothetical protein
MQKFHFRSFLVRYTGRVAFFRDKRNNSENDRVGAVYYFFSLTSPNRTKFLRQRERGKDGETDYFYIEYPTHTLILNYYKCF